LADIAEIEQIGDLPISLVMVGVHTLMRRMLYFLQSALRKGSVNLKSVYVLESDCDSPDRYLSLLRPIHPHLWWPFSVYIKASPLSSVISLLQEDHVGYSRYSQHPDDPEP
jgi:hypothetical protein